MSYGKRPVSDVHRLGDHSTGVTHNSIVANPMCVPRQHVTHNMFDAHRLGDQYAVVTHWLLVAKPMRVLNLRVTHRVT